MVICYGLQPGGLCCKAHGRVVVADKLWLCSEFVHVVNMLDWWGRAVEKDVCWCLLRSCRPPSLSFLFLDERELRQVRLAVEVPATDGVM